MLKIFNTFSKKKEIFIPKNKNKVNIYVCGITISDYCHIGHGRTFYFFDILLRYLKFLGYKCNYVRNITDISSKLINNIKNINNFKILSNSMINAMNNDFLNLNFLKPNFEPKISDNINLIIFYIKELLIKNYAFIDNFGNVLYKDKKKKNNNFILWKIINNRDKKKKFIGWNSPWGNGIPGWHIGCCVLSNYYLSNIDIHGGGFDLLFPHHKNEILLSKCIFNKKNFVSYWIHSGLVIYNNYKLSKSFNNYFLINDLLKIYHPDVIKYFLMSTHYRKKIFLNFDKLNFCKTIVNKLYFSIKDLNLDINLLKNDFKGFIEFDDYFIKFMNDDFNIPKVYNIIFYMINEINRLKKKSNYFLASKLGVKMKNLLKIIGLLNFNIEDYFKNKKILNIKFVNYNILNKIKKLIKIRNIARLKKKWNVADYIREKLKKNNVFLIDYKNNFTDWYLN